MASSFEPSRFLDRFAGLKKKVIYAIAGLIALWLFAPFAIVGPGQRGVLVTLGSVSNEVFGEGIHLRIPLIQSMHLVDVRIQKGEGQGDAASKDLQSVKTAVALNYHLMPSQVVNIYRDIGLDVAEKLILPSTQEAVKAATAKFTAEELITKRPEVREEIRALLKTRLQPHGIMVDEFSIVNFEFSRSFAEAVEAKTTAEQQKLKADRDLMRIKVEATQKVESAKAEAESLSLQKSQVTPELIRLREIEAQRKAIEKWDGHLPSVTGGAVPFINVTTK